MQCAQSATVRKFRRILIETPYLFALDGRTKEAKTLEAQRRLLICMATDEDLEQMAEIATELFPYPVDQMVKDLKAAREEYRKTGESWRKYLGKTQK